MKSEADIREALGRLAWLARNCDLAEENSLAAGALLWVLAKGCDKMADKFQEYLDLAECRQ